VEIFNDSDEEENDLTHEGNRSIVMTIRERRKKGQLFLTLQGYFEEQKPYIKIGR